MANCFENGCKLNELNINGISALLGGVDISKADKDKGVVVLATHRAGLISTLPVDVLRNYLQEANPNIEIIYGDDTIDEITQRKDKPLWAFKNNGSTIELKRVVEDGNN